MLLKRDAQSLCKVPGVGMRRGLASAVTSNLKEIQDEFTRQSQGFEADWLNRSKQSTHEVMSWVLDSIENDGGAIDPTTKALDVACGTGIFARALLPHCAEVTGLDATEAMLDRARTATQDQEGADRITFLTGDAGKMPFDSDSFDLVVSRLAIHHFPNPEEQVREIARVVRPGGRVVIVDITSPQNAEVAARLDELETLRDPTHTHTLSIPTLANLLSSHGLALVNDNLENIPQLDIEMALEGWMESTKTGEADRATIRTAINAELTGDGPATGMFPKAVDGEIVFVHKYAVMEAVKPAN